MVKGFQTTNYLIDRLHLVNDRQDINSFIFVAGYILKRADLQHQRWLGNLIVAWCNLQDNYSIKYLSTFRARKNYMIIATKRLLKNALEMRIKRVTDDKSLNAKVSVSMGPNP